MFFGCGILLHFLDMKVIECGKNKYTLRDSYCVEATLRHIPLLLSARQCASSFALQHSVTFKP